MDDADTNDSVDLEHKSAIVTYDHLDQEFAYLAGQELLRSLTYYIQSEITDPIKAFAVSHWVLIRNRPSKSSKRIEEAAGKVQRTKEERKTAQDMYLGMKSKGGKGQKNSTLPEERAGQAAKRRVVHRIFSSNRIWN
ncbi:MAG: hypothetical protein Q9210_001058 [Variospora velana]